MSSQAICKQMAVHGGAPVCTTEDVAHLWESLTKEPFTVGHCAAGNQALPPDRQCKAAVLIRQQLAGDRLPVQLALPGVQRLRQVQRATGAPAWAPSRGC